MALRASSSSAIRAAKAEGAPRAAATRTLVIDLAAVLVPYKKKIIGLRIERVPQRARFSAGRKNGDNSWSLTREDIDGLEYMLPEEVATDHTIAIRIMDLDAAGSTLKLVEYKVKMEDALPAAADEAVTDTAPVTDNGEVERLREELAKLQASVASQPAPQPASRDHSADAKLTAAQVEISHLRKQLAAAAAREAAAHEQQEQEIATHLAEARAEFAAELERRMSASTGTTASELQRHRAAWQAEFATVQEQWNKDAAAALATAEQTWKQTSEKALSDAEQAWKSAEAARAADAEQAWKAAEAKRFADAEQAWKAAEAKRLADAEQAWKTEEAKRLAAREAEWQAQSAKAVDGIRSETTGVRDDAHGQEVAALKEKVAKLEASLADRDLVLIESQKAAIAAQDQSARELKDALANAEQEWHAAEAKRFAAAEQAWEAAEAKRFTDLEAEWQAKLAAANEATKAPPPPPPAPTNDEELKQLRAQAAEFKTTLADYDAAMGQAQKAAVDATANTDKKIAEALAKAEAAWKDGDAARVAAKNSEWQAKLKKAVDEARAEVPPPVVTAPAVDNAAELKALREQIEELESTLIDRDATIERLESDAAAAHDAMPGDLKDELVKAERTWKAGEAERIAAAQTQARFDQQRQLADAVSRYEQAEAALAHMRIRAADDNRAHNEVTTLRATLGVREHEINDLKKKLDEVRGYVPPEDGGDLSAQSAAPVAEPAKPARGNRDMMIAAAAGVLLIFGIMFSDLLLPQAPAPQPAAPKVAAAVPAPVVELPKVETAKNAKVRATADANAEVIARLPAGAKVSELERKAPWARVRIAAEGKEPAREGWVYISVLKEAPVATAAEKQKAK